MFQDRTLPKKPLGQDWLDQVFRGRAVLNGGVIRRRVSDVHREIGLPALELEVRRRGFRMVRSASHYVIFCNSAPLEIIC